MIEAIALGCFPLCPNRLVFPEYLDDEFLYNTDSQLVKKLVNFTKRPFLIRNKDSWSVSLEQFKIASIIPKYYEALKIK